MKNYYYALALIPVLMLISASHVTGQLELVSGHIYYAKQSAVSPTQRWEGVIGSLSVGMVEESNEAIGWITMDSANQIIVAYFSGNNFLDGKHYIVFIPENITFNLTKLENITQADLEENGIFNSQSFPIFHPEYQQKSDNPKNTFCCKTGKVTIGGVEFYAFATSLKQNVPYYLLKYKVNESYEVPVFLTPLDSYIGYDGTPCNFEAILPVSKTYYIYILSKEPPIKLDVWIDGVKTTQFNQTALPYNLTIRATNLYTGEPLENVSIIVFEENGRNIFIPRHLTGEVARGVSLTHTNEEGYAQFIVAPTEYPVSESYSIGVAVSADGIVLSRRLNLTVENAGEIVFEKKSPTAGTALLDNVKVTVNTMNQIINSMYLWSSKYEKGFVYNLVYYTNGTYYFINQSDWKMYDNATLHTGAPNKIIIQIKEPDGSDANGYYAVFNEIGGYLLFNPTFDTPIIGDKTRINRFLKIENNEFCIVSPTSYADAYTNVTLTIYNPSGIAVGIVPFEIDRNLLPGEGGVSLSDDLYKTSVNAMNSVGYSLYYSLN